MSSDLHDEIMNLPRPKFAPEDSAAVAAFQQGFREACHAAAELAAARADDAQEMREALQVIVRIEDREWKPMQVYRSDEQVARDEARHDLAQEIADIARAALAQPTPKE